MGGALFIPIALNSMPALRLGHPQDVVAHRGSEHLAQRQKPPEAAGRKPAEKKRASERARHPEGARPQGEMRPGVGAGGETK